MLFVRSKEKEEERRCDFVSSFVVVRVFSFFPSFCHDKTPFFSSKEKKSIIIKVLLLLRVSFSLSFFLSFANASIINERAGEGERESFGDDENTVYE